MKPTFKRNRGPMNFLSQSLLLFPLVLGAWQIVQAEGEKPTEGSVLTQASPNYVPADPGGDTLDTSTPAPVGIEEIPNTEKVQPSLATPDPEEVDSTPEWGGFILPIEGDVFYDPEIRILFSLPGVPPASMVLLLDGYPEKSALTISEGLLSVPLRNLKSGAHQLTLLLFNERTEIISRQETRFFVRLPEPNRGTRTSAYKQFGRIVGKVDWKNGEAKGRILSQNALKLKPGTSDSLMAGDPETPVSQELDGAMEAAYNIKYKQVQAFGKVLLRTDENRFRQPAHRMTTSLKYGPWAAIKAGDVYPLYNSLVLNGTRVRGGEAMLSVVTGEKSWGSLRVVRGESRREVPAYLAKYDTGNGTRVDTISGTYAQTLSAIRLGFGGGPSFDMGLTLMKASDHSNSEESEKINRVIRGLRPSENLVPGLDLRMGFWDGRIQLYGNSALSLYTRDRSLGAFHPDSSDIAFDARDYENFITFNATTRGWQYLLSSDSTNDKMDFQGFLGANSAYEAGFVSSIPFEGIITETELRYSHLGLDYHSEGNPFLGGNPGDGFTLIEKLIVLENKLSLAMELGNYSQDLGLSAQTQRSLKVELRFTPGPYQPSLWIGGGRTNIAPDGSYPQEIRSGFINFNTGAYHQFQLPQGKLYTTLLYGFTESEMSIKTTVTGQLPQDFPTTNTNIINGMLQYKMKDIAFLPRMVYSFSHNGFQLPSHSMTLGFLQPFLENTVRLDLATTVGQYPESNTKNDVSLAASTSIEYVLGPQQTFRLRERWSQYGKHRNLLVGANYELFF